VWLRLVLRPYTLSVKLYPLLLAAVLTLSAGAQTVSNPRASFIDVSARQAKLAATADPLLLAAIKRLPSCVATPPIPAPRGRMEIPHPYLSGSNGPINPAEAAATRIYGDFEKRITAGMNRYVATGSHEESACALAQLDLWAQAKALLDYDPKDSSQAWYQVEWTLSCAGVTDSVLVIDATLDTAKQRRVTAWLDTAAGKLISFEKPGDSGNNHHYWRALAAISIGVAASDNKLFRFGADTFKQAVDEIDPNGAFPREMARHENAIHYQGFALQPLLIIAEFAGRQATDLDAYRSHGRTLRDAVVFYARAVEDPALVKPYASEPQKPSSGNDFAALVFYAARFGGQGLTRPILDAFQHPLTETRIGGNATVLAAP
jgi:poly(beta-D-mannuronate) lyase